VILQTVRSEEFAPVKNASGEDSPAVTERMMMERAALWLEQAGVKVPRKADGRLDCELEMSPLFALTAEDVKAKVEKIPPIRPGDRVYLE
jgi:UDP-N-acetylglucosamine pyrophosphorylase